jgi:RHS repeat-associated protein
LGDSYEGTLKNNYLYNGKELFDDADLNWYDYGFRNYDPQIGRFPQLDPLTDSYPFLTPYQYASCDPITNIDVDGLEGCPSVAGMTGYVGTMGHMAGGGGIALGNIFNGIAAVVRIAGPVAGIVNSAANTINTTSQQSVVKQQLATNSINGGFTTSGAGAGDVGHGPNRGDDTDEDNGWPWPGTFNTIRDAANDFAKHYNQSSITNNKEYSGYIYSATVWRQGKSVTIYSYTIPDPKYSGKGWSKSTPAPEYSTIVAEVHTHGAYEYSYPDPTGFNGTDNFSKNTKLFPEDGDIEIYEKHMIYGYVATPNGSLLEYDPFKKQVTRLNQDQASDPNDPTSKNYIPPKIIIPRAQPDKTGHRIIKIPPKN